MRLICPNCTAQYEVDATMIPDEGRDVQCSNCGHTWYELPPPEAALAVEDDGAPEVEAEPWEAPEAEPVPESEPKSEPEPEFVAEEPELDEPEPEPEPEFDEPEPEPEPEPVHDEPEPEVVAQAPEAEPEPEPEPVGKPTKVYDDDDDDDGDDSWDWPETRLVSPAADTVEGGATKPTNMRRPADVAALDLLREEADREMSQRKSSTPSTLEVQTDFSLSEPEKVDDTPSRALKARMGRLDTRDAMAQAESEYVEPRRELLPDIEEINSTLRPAPDEITRGARTPEQELRHRKGFRLGFVASVGIAALMVVSYVWAPSIASALPATESVLISYVDVANAARDALDTLFGGSG